MNVKTMEGLAGASASMSLISTPMNVAKEAERKGDTEKTQRALGYAAGMKEQAEEYEKKTEKGMKADSEEAKKQEKLRQEELIEARRREREEQEKWLKGENGRGIADDDSVDISLEGKLQTETTGGGQTMSETAEDLPEKNYDQSGESVELAAAGENVNVAV